MTKKRSILAQKPYITPSKQILSFSLLANGSMVSKQVQLIKLEVSYSFNQIPIAAIELADPDFQWCDSANFLPGVSMKINVGYYQEEKEIFTGTVLSQTMKQTESGNLLILELQDPAFVLNSTKRAALFNENTDSEIISAIVSRYPGLSVKIEPVSNIPNCRIQPNCSDWDFILEIAKINGCFVLLKSGGLTLKQLPISGTASIKLERKNVYEYHLQLSSNFLSENVKGKVWNYQDQTVDALNFQLEEGLPKELADSIALQDFELLENQYGSLQEMSSALKNKISESIFSFAKGRLKIAGTADINVGDLVELTDFGQRMSGNAFVAAVSHFLSNGQWHTELEIGLTAPSQKESDRTSFAGLHIAIVQALEGDPLHQNRIKIKFPLIESEANGIWARVSLPDGGNDRGFYFLPELGDEVLVSFLAGGFNDPIILGGLHSSKNPAPYPESDDNNLKGIVTKNKMKLIFDDDEKSILIETPQGNKIKIADQIQVEDSLGNKLTLDEDGISLESIKDLNLKANGDINLSGVNIKVASAASLELKSSAKSELSSSGSVIVKGAIVQIN